MSDHTSPSRSDAEPSDSAEKRAAASEKADVRSGEAAHVPPWLLLRVWLGLGLQSFGGGGATLTLIRRAVVEQHRWISAEEFSRDWALCQVAPGINLLGLTILIGRRLGGGTGICLCLLGLLLSSVTLTIALTALYAHIRDSQVVKAALRAVIPASVGLGLLTAYNIARPPLAASRRAGGGAFVFGLLVIAGSGAALLLGEKRLSVVLILAVAGVLSALVHWRYDVAAKGRKGGTGR
jgi:chromate transporter